jgi:hypothetical protein
MGPPRRLSRLAALLLAGLLATTVGAVSPTLADSAPTDPEVEVSPTPEPDPVLVGAGDIAYCDSDNDESTAKLLDDIPGTVFTVGDNAYLDGTPKEFTECYEPTWGRHKARTRPAVGNHEYQGSAVAAGYFDYFGSAAGEPGTGWYDYRVGAWHVIVLNSMCDAVGGCGVGSAQEGWLRGVLAESDAECTVAIMHHPQFSSGVKHGATTRVLPLWQALYEFGAEVVLSGHDHHYERFAMQTPGGAIDAVFGIRQFIVGTGGRDHVSGLAAMPNSEVRDLSTYGVLKLTLHADSYGWEFVPVAGKTFTDHGTAACHGAPTTLAPPPPPPPPPPDPIKRVASSSNGSSRARSKLTISRPAGTQPGHVMVAAIAGSESASEFTAPAGWTPVREEKIPGAVRQAVYVKVAGASEPSSFTFTTSVAQRVAGGITTYSGVDTADPVDAAAVALNSTAATSVKSPSITTSVPNARLVQLVAVNAEGKLHPPKGMTERWEARAPSSSSKRDALASSSDTRQSVPGPSGGWSATVSTRGRSIVVLLALRPVT